MTQKKYNYCFDYLKCIACIFVVFMHCEFPGVFGTAVQAISRFCVPFFFMISGYYSYNTSTESSKRKVKRIVKMTIYASVFYLIFALVQWALGQNINPISKRDIILWVLFNRPVIIVGQLWFLLALIYVYLLYYVVQKKNLYKLAYGAIIVLIAIYIFLAQGMHIVGKDMPNFLYRNFLVEGFPLFMLGEWLHKEEKKFNFSNKAIITVIVASTLMCFLERAVMGRDFGINISTFVQVIAIFIYGINNSEKHKGVMQEIGKKCSMFVYILHPFVWKTLDIISEKISIKENVVFSYSLPVMVIIITLMLAWYCNKIIFERKKIIKQ